MSIESHSIEAACLKRVNMRTTAVNTALPLWSESGSQQQQRCYRLMANIEKAGAQKLLPLHPQLRTSTRRCRLSMNLLPVLVQKRKWLEGPADG